MTEKAYRTKWKRFAGIALGFGFILTLIVMVTYVYLQSFYKLQAMGMHIAQTHEALSELDQVEFDLTRAESAECGYLLTGNRLCLDGVTTDPRILMMGLDQAVQLCTDDPTLNSTFHRLHQLVEQRATLLSKAIVLARNGHKWPVRKTMSSDEIMTMSEAHGHFEKVRHSERLQLSQQAQLYEDYTFQTQISFLCLGILIVVLLGYVYHTMRNFDSRRRAAEHLIAAQFEQIQDYNELLEHQMAQLEKANYRLEEVATVDGLTEIKNHRAFQEQLATEFARAMRYQTPLSVLIMDVDNFKSFNDTFGHPEGDIVLRRVAQLLIACSRETDIVARYGGEEFAIILPETDAQGAMVMAERMRHAIETEPWERRTITASFGAAGYAAIMEDANQLITCADRALYCSKNAGRNRVTKDGDIECAAKPVNH